MQEIDSPSWKCPMQAWLQAMQARMSSVRAGLRLVGHFGIADHRARHAAHVGRPFGDHLLRLMRLVDAPGDEHRLADRLLQLARIGRHIGVLDEHRRHDMDGARLARPTYRR